MENNATMTKENQDIITGIMGVEPIYINSNLLTAQERKRLYWTNIPDIIAGLLALIVAAYLAFRIAAAIFEQQESWKDSGSRKGRKHDRKN